MQVVTKLGVIKAVAEHLKILKTELLKWKEEEKQIVETSIQFALFLKHNAITPYNDALGEYLDHLMVIETNKEIRARLQHILEEFKKEINCFDLRPQNANSIKRTPTPQLIKIPFERLHAMKHMGSVIKNAKTLVEDAAMVYVNNNEVVYNSNKVGVQERGQCNSSTFASMSDQRQTFSQSDRHRVTHSSVPISSVQSHLLSAPLLLTIKYLIFRIPPVTSTNS